MITKRQEQLLDFLIREYISTAEPISSKALQKVADLDVCGATIRNDLQELTKHGFIDQPHTSAGRIPTKKAYQYFAEKISAERQEKINEFIFEEIKRAQRQIENEMRLTEELMKSLSQISLSLEVSFEPKSETLFKALTILGPTRIICEENEDIISKIIKDLENF